jgi:hypothetical protein
MDVKRISVDFTKIEKPLHIGVSQWIREHGLSPPCLIMNENAHFDDSYLKHIEKTGKNVISAIPAPVHPYLYAKQDRDTGDVFFPFRERIGVGKRRQDLQPVFLYVPAFALFWDLNAPFIPSPLTNGRRRGFPLNGPASLNI